MTADELYDLLREHRIIDHGNWSYLSTAERQPFETAADVTEEAEGEAAVEVHKEAYKEGFDDAKQGVEWSEAMINDITAKLPSSYRILGDEAFRNIVNAVCEVLLVEVENKRNG